MQQRSDQKRRRYLLTFFCVAVSISGCTFLFKLFAFLSTIRRDELAGFAYNPVLIYGFVAAGFLLLLAWAFMSGQLRNLEESKVEWMERFQEQERHERRGVSQ